jgi:hypothetical protein
MTRQNKQAQIWLLQDQKHVSQMATQEKALLTERLLDSMEHSAQARKQGYIWQLHDVQKVPTCCHRRALL